MQGELNSKGGRSSIREDQRLLPRESASELIRSAIPKTHTHDIKSWHGPQTTSRTHLRSVAHSHRQGAHARPLAARPLAFQRTPDVAQLLAAVGQVYRRQCLGAPSGAHLPFLSHSLALPVPTSEF